MTRLVLWLLLGIASLAVVMGGALNDNLWLFGIGLVFVLLAQCVLFLRRDWTR